MAEVSPAHPDTLLPADHFTSTDPTVPVKLRVVISADDSSADSRAAVSVPSLMVNTARLAKDQVALAVKRDGVWQKWTYQRYLRDVRTVAKAFIKLGLQPAHGVGVIGKYGYDRRVKSDYSDQFPCLIKNFKTVRLNPTIG